MRRVRVQQALAAAALAVPLLSSCTSDDLPRVAVAEVRAADVTEVVEAPGAVAARAVAGVSSPADAVVAAVLVDDGASVRRGQVLLRLTSEAAQQRLQAALAASAASPAAAAALAQARAAVDALTVRAPLDGVVSLGASAPSAASPALDGLPEALQGLAGGAGSGSGVVVGELSPGTRVGTGTPLLTVVDASRLSVVAEVDETDVLLVKSGQRGQVELDAVPGARYAATVTGVEQTPTASARGGVTYRVRLSLGDGEAAGGEPAPRPRAGMSAVVDLEVRQASDALAVPSAAVVAEGGRDVVLVLDGDRVRRREVVVGARGEDVVQVVRGLSAGDRVVSRDAERLRDGQRVRT